MPDHKWKPVEAVKEDPMVAIIRQTQAYPCRIKHNHSPTEKKAS